MFHVEHAPDQLKQRALNAHRRATHRHETDEASWPYCYLCGEELSSEEKR